MQLEATGGSLPAFARYVFQFHIGAIRSACGRDRRAMIIMFQFHIGAIRRALLSLLPPPCCRFNSILVQLEVDVI